MSYSTLPAAPSDLFGGNSTLRSRVFALNGDHRGDESRSPMSEPRSPIFRPSLPAEIPPHFASLYNSPYAAAAVAAAVAGQGSGGPSPTTPFTHFGRVPSASMFYPGMVGGEAWRRAPYLSQLDMYWPGLRSLEAVVGPRTKAPREATSILKSWLNEHKDNPYPTKSEKMTLSIVTHMTLTQVSTWFANARRRIKKENKMTWTPKTRCGDRDDNSSNEEESDKDYFGRQRSPFSIPQDLPDGSMQNCNESSRSTFLTRPVSNSTAHYPADMPTKVHAHPLFTAFSGLRSPYHKTNTPRDDIRSEKPDTEETEDRLLRRSDSNTDESNVKETATAENAFARTAKEESASENDESISQDESFPSPFIQLRKHRSMPMELPEAKKRRLDDVERHEPRSPVEVPILHKTPDYTDSSAKVSNFHDSYYKETVDPASNTNSTSKDSLRCAPSEGKMDALASWFRDFQRLVTTGQEDKARQALAAFALAAKAEAYTDFGASTSSPQLNFLPQNDSSDGSFPINDRQCPSPSSDQSSPPTAHENRSFRYPLFQRSQYRNGVEDSERCRTDSKICLSKSPTSAMRAQKNNSPQNRSSNNAPENAPINLTKPSTEKAWENGDFAEARSEA